MRDQAFLERRLDASPLSLKELSTETFSNSSASSSNFLRRGRGCERWARHQRPLVASGLAERSFIKLSAAGSWLRAMCITALVERAVDGNVLELVRRLIKLSAAGSWLRAMGAASATTGRQRSS